MGTPMTQDGLVSWIGINFTNKVRDVESLLTEVTYVEGALGFRRKRFEALEPRVRRFPDFFIVWINCSWPRPVFHGLWKIEDRRITHRGRFDSFLAVGESKSEFIPVFLTAQFVT